MSSTAGNDELLELLPAAALEILSAEDLQLVLSHARRDSDSARRLAEYREVVALMSLRLPPQPMHPKTAAAVRGRLLNRVRHIRAARSLADWGSGSLVAAAVGGVLLLHHAVHRPMDYGWLVAGALTLTLVAVGIYARVQRARAAALRNRMNPGQDGIKGEVG